jgi:hypothetical protein
MRDRIRYAYDLRAVSQLGGYHLYPQARADLALIAGIVDLPGRALCMFEIRRPVPTSYTRDLEALSH